MQGGQAGGDGGRPDGLPGGAGLSSHLSHRSPPHGLGVLDEVLAGGTAARPASRHTDHSVQALAIQTCSNRYDTGPAFKGMVHLTEDMASDDYFGPPE